MKKYKLINGHIPQFYIGLKKEMLNGNYPITRKIEVAFGKDGIGTAEDDIDMEHYLRDGIMKEIKEEVVVRETIEVVPEEITPEEIIKTVEEVVPEEETIAEEVIEDEIVEPIAIGDIVEEVAGEDEEVTTVEEIIEEEPEVEEVKETKKTPVIAKKRGRKPKA